MPRPVGFSAGVLGLVFAWFGGAAIVRLTGAAPVMLVLAAGFVLFVGALASGWFTASRIRVGPVELPPMSTAGEPVPMRAAVGAPRPVWVEARVSGVAVSRGWAAAGQYAAPVTMERRGRVDEIELRVRTPGPIGLVWWGRRFDVRIAEHLVAPRPQHGDASIDTAEVGAAGDMAGAPGASAGEIDGVRPWRDGDAEHAVHWPSTLRTGELVVRDRLHETGGLWIVRARPGGADPDYEAGVVRRALEQGLRAGARVFAAVGDGEPDPIADGAAAERWTALVHLGDTSRVDVPWWRRSIALGGRNTEPETTAAVSSRWWAAAATMTSIAMLAGALGYPPVFLLATGVGVAVGAHLTARSLVSGEPVSAVTRGLLGAGALVALALVVAASGRLDSILGFLRGPLPQVLIVLIVLHGFECRDRRTIRVAVAISGIVVMYAAGFRVDDRVGWWIAGWGLAAVVAITKLSTPTDRPPAADAVSGPAVRWLARVGAVGAGAVATVAVLVVVPVPDGPARLTLPTFVDDRAVPVGQPGAIAGPDGEVRDASGTTVDDPSRAPAGQAGGYIGFANSMDTSVRGDLGDEVVMRVRAPAPDFWRGQTFGRFDGRTWYADDDTGVQRDGPNIDVPAAIGDIPPAADVEVDRFVQTFYVEADMPNVVFHAYRPTQVILDADVWTRRDGAIRATMTFADETIYTVVSDRPRVDAALLHRQGHIGPRLSDLGRRVLGPYLEVPATTTPETIRLANELAAGRSSTYEVVEAYTAWLEANVEYDLRAPLPEPGEDAVHDFLFDTRLGFCEQIASALTVMLRTQGVPARLATGYLPGTRDRIAGVFEVKASDAHAWVEVWFPESGWQAFDPTASVPLSADAEIGSLGADLANGARRYADRHAGWLAAAAATVTIAFGAWHLLRLLRHRRRRGRWGLLQDRFAGMARRRGAPDEVSNRRRVHWWADPEDVEVARTVADRLDRVAFDPSFTDDDEAFRETRELVGSLGGSRR